MFGPDGRQPLDAGTVSRQFIELALSLPGQADTYAQDIADAIKLAGYSGTLAA